MIDPRSPEHNYVVVKGVRSPGRAQVTGAEAPYIWQVQDGWGRDGKYVLYRGRDIAHPTLTLTLWRPEHFAQWEVFKKAIQPPTADQPFFYAMQHPLLASAGITSLSTENIAEPIRQPGIGWVATVKLIEYRAPKPVIIPPKGTVPAPDKGKPRPPKTEADFAALDAGAAYLVARSEYLGRPVSLADARRTIAEQGLDRANEQYLGTGPIGPPAP